VLWGCHKKIEVPKKWINCPRCLGQNPLECKLCDEEGLLGLLRCPLYYVHRAGELNRYFSLYLDLKQYHQLPEQGAILDQNNKWYESTQIFRRVLAELQRAAIDNARK
jgi:hypothetical protein